MKPGSPSSLLTLPYRRRTDEGELGSGPMNRPAQHVTDSRGQTLLRSALERFGWTLSVVVADYGIDFDIEVFEDGKATGITFKIQLKSSLATQYSADGAYISQPLDTKNARYLVREMQTPTILVHADVQKGQTYWIAPQLETEAVERLKTRDDRGTLTFRIPRANSLPGTVGALLDSVSRSKVLIATRTIIHTPVVNFVSVLGKQPDAEVMVREFRSKADALDARRAFDLMFQGKLAEAEAAAQALWQDPRTVLETKFSIVLTLEQIETRRAIQERWPDDTRERLRLIAADRLDMLVGDCSEPLRAYAVLFRKVAMLDVLLQENWGVFLRIDIGKKQGIDATAAAEMAFRLADVTDKVRRKMRQCYRLVNYAARSRHGYALADPIVRLAKSLMRLSAQFRALYPHADVSGGLNAQSLELLRLAAIFSARGHDEQSFMQAVVAARLIAEDPETESYLWMRNELAKITTPEIKRAADDYLDRINRRANGEELPFTIETTDRQILENLALGVGVNVSDPEHPIARAVRIGINDLDPTRVLRQCEHLSVRGSTRAATIGGIHLPIASPQVIQCVKHGHGLTGISLDSTYEAFRQKHCVNCPDARPRPANWQYIENAP
ncbi:MAG: DUF4365 domain-containing protein [Acidobacteriota bacterium]